MAVALRRIEIMPFEGGEIREPRDAFPTSVLGWLSAPQSIVLDVESTVSRKRVAAGLLIAYLGVAYAAVTIVPIAIICVAVVVTRGATL